MRILEIGLGVLWLAIAGGSTVLIIRDGIRQKRGRNTTPPTSPTDEPPVGYQAAANANRKHWTRRYDQPHSIPLPHWYSK